MPLSSPRRRWTVALLWSLLVAVLLLTPGEELPDVGLDPVDKLAHVLIFGSHCFLLRRALAGRAEGGATRVAAASVSGVYAVLLEVAQLWVPGRGFEWWDLVANAVGVALAALLPARPRATLRHTS